MAAPNKKINCGIIQHILTPFCIAEANSGKQSAAGPVQHFLRQFWVVAERVSSADWWACIDCRRAFFDILGLPKILTQYDQTKILIYYTIHFQKCHKPFFLWRQFYWCQSFENNVNAFVWFCSIFESIQCLWNSWRPNVRCDYSLIFRCLECSMHYVVLENYGIPNFNWIIDAYEHD